MQKYSSEDRNIPYSPAPLSGRIQNLLNYYQTTLELPNNFAEDTIFLSYMDSDI